MVKLPLELPVRVLMPEESVVENGRGNSFGGSEVTWKNDTGLFGLLHSMVFPESRISLKRGGSLIQPVCRKVDSN